MARFGPLCKQLLNSSHLGFQLCVQKMMDGLLMIVHLGINAGDLRLDSLLLLVLVGLECRELLCQLSHFGFKFGNPAICINFHFTIIQGMFGQAFFQGLF